MNPVIAYYDQLAQVYDADRFANSYGQFIDQQERKVLDVLLKDRPGAVLDLACGSGRLLNYATAGLDGSPQMLAVAAQKYPDKPLHLASADATPFADASFDAIISFHFLMHLDAATVERVFAECHRILRPGGRLVVDVPSRSRRRLLRYRSTHWHGAYSTTAAELQSRWAAQFALERSLGLLLLPIHRLPAGLRKYLIGLDRVLAQVPWLKAYSSYLILEFRKK